MAPLPQQDNGPLTKYTALRHVTQVSRLAIKRHEDPNDQDCHGWGCYTSAGRSGIIFMSVIVPVVLFLVFWLAVMRPIMDNMSISDLDDVQEQQPQPPLQQPVQPPQESQPQGQGQQPKDAPVPPPEQPNGPPPPPPEPQPPSPPQNQQTPTQSLLKLPPTAAAENASPPAPYQSPTVVLNFNAPKMSNPFLSPSVAPESPENGQPVQKPAEQPVQKQAQQQNQQPVEQTAGESARQQSEEAAGQQPEQQPDYQPPAPQAAPGGSQMPFPLYQSFPPGQPFPPGIPYQPPPQPIYFAAPQFMPILPPPPPPLPGQAVPASFAAGNQPFPGPPGPNLTNQIPQITSYSPPVPPPSFQVKLPQHATPAFRGQPDSPTTFNTTCSTAQQSMLSRSHRHPPLGRARTMSDSVSEHGSSDPSTPSSFSEITLPSETSTGNNNGLEESEEQYREGVRKAAKKQGRAEAHARRNTSRPPKDTYQRRPEGRYRHDTKDVTARRVRPMRRESSRSRSPDNRR